MAPRQVVTELASFQHTPSVFSLSRGLARTASTDNSFPTSASCELQCRYMERVVTGRRQAGKDHAQVRGHMAAIGFGPK